MNSFKPAPQELFFSKNDPKDIRLGELFKSITTPDETQGSCLTLLGYPDDEGISLNGGRAGARLAPEQIRKFLYKMTPPNLNLTSKFLDLGDLISSAPLAEKHQVAKSYVLSLLSNKSSKFVSLGGGHDYGYSDASAFLDSCLNQGIKPLVINFDAHLDVRPSHQGFHSGTPFYRLLNEYHSKFHFVEIGIQNQCNSPHHKKWALDQGAYIFDLNQIKRSSLISLFDQAPFQELPINTPCFISFDLDALSSDVAGGCSQSWPTGLTLDECLLFIARIYKTTDTRGLGLYEVSPPYDQENRTAKCAALLAYNFIFQDLL
jgi:formiminoglutamase